MSCGGGQLLSKSELQAELEFPWSTGFIEITKVRVARLAEVRIRSVVLQRQEEGGVIRGRKEKIRAVEEIEHLSAELYAIAFTHSPILVYGEVNVGDARSYDRAASQGTKPPDTR